MSKKEFASLEFQERLTLNWKQLGSFFFVFTITLLYIFYLPFKIWFNLLIDIIMADWQLIFAVIIIFALTIGWYLIEGIALLIISMNIKINQRLTSKSLNKVRYTIVIYFVILMFCYFYFPYSFEDAILWIISILVFFAILMGMIGLKYLRRSIIIQRIKTGKTQPKSNIEKIKEGYESAIFPKELPEEITINLWVALAIGFTAIFGVVLFLTNGLGFKDILIYLFETINQSFLVSLLFWVIIILTILWKPILWLALFINYLSMKLIKDSVKRKINTTRIMLLLFVAIMVFVGFLPIIAPILGWNEIEVQVMSIIFGFIGSAIITWYLRKPK